MVGVLTRVRAVWNTDAGPAKEQTQKECDHMSFCGGLPLDPRDDGGSARRAGDLGGFRSNWYDIHGECLDKR